MLQRENSTGIRSSVIDEERTRPGHWFGLVLCVLFRALIGWQDRHLGGKRPHSMNRQMFSFTLSGRG